MIKKKRRKTAHFPPRKDIMRKLISFVLLALLLTTVTACKRRSERIDVPETTAEFRYGDAIMNYDYSGLDFSKYLEIPDLSKIKAPIDEVDEAWENAVKIIRYENVSLSSPSSNGTAALSDEVNIHYKGDSNSPLIVLSSATRADLTNYEYDDNGNLIGGLDLVLGSDAMVGAYESKTRPDRNNLGFEEQLVGAKVGETRTVTVTFPDDYSNEELRGTVVRFEVTVNSLRKGTLPELTDQMVKTFTEGEYTTINGLKEYVTSYHKQRLALSAVTEAFKVKSRPGEAMDSAIARYVANYIALNYDEELTEAQTKTVYNEQYKNAQKNAKETVGERLILEYLFKRFGVTLSSSEYTKMRNDDYEQNSFTYLYYYGVTSADEYESLFGKDYLTTKYKQNKLAVLLPDAIIFE